MQVTKGLLENLSNVKKKLIKCKDHMGPSKICGRQPLKTLKKQTTSTLEYFVSYGSTKSD